MQESENETEESLEQEWNEIKTIFKDTSNTTLGYRKRGRKQWISDNTWNSIQERKDIKKKLYSTKSERIKTALQKEYSNKDKEVKRNAKADRKEHLETLAREAETAASRGQLSTVDHKTTKRQTNTLQ